MNIAYVVILTAGGEYCALASVDFWSHSSVMQMEGVLSPAVKLHEL